MNAAGDVINGKFLRGRWLAGSDFPTRAAKHRSAPTTYDPATNPGRAGPVGGSNGDAMPPPRRRQVVA